MSMFRVDISVSGGPDSEAQTVGALVDTGTMHTVLPGKLLREIGISPTLTTEFELADGSVVEFEVGTALVAINGYDAVTPVAFGPDDAEPLLGAVALELMELLVDPKNRRLIPTRRGRRHL